MQLRRDTGAQVQTIDGKAIAARANSETAQSARMLADDMRRPVKLEVVLVGDDPASETYVNAKRKACLRHNIAVHVQRFGADVAESELLGHLRALNDEEKTDGVLLQLPLPKRLDTDLMLAAIDPLKDVDGLTPENLGLLAAGEPRLVPATPLGVMRLLEDVGFEFGGSDVAVVGRSRLVGMPLAMMLTSRGATVTVCHSRTRDLGGHVRRADAVVAAAGVPGLVTAEMVKPGAVVVDVGINKIEAPDAPRGYRLVGDVDFEGVAGVASAVTPVPGGVGPMTIAMLMENVVRAAELRRLAG